MPEPVTLYDPAGKAIDLTNYYESRVPVRRVTVFRDPGSPAVSIGLLDVDGIHRILSGAEGGFTRELFSFYDQLIESDNHIQGELQKRKLAVLGDPWQVQPADPDRAEDVAAAGIIKAILDDTPSFFDACSNLLDSTIYPVTVVEKVYKPSRRPGLRFEIDDLIKVPYELLDYSEDRQMRIHDTDANGDPQPTKHFVDEIRYIVHRGHLLGKRDWRGGPLRSLVFWWFFSMADRDSWARLLDRFGAPFMIGKYDQADDASRTVLQNAFSLAARLGGIVVSRETEVQLMDSMSKASPDAFEKFLGVCQREKSKLIIGQTSADVQPTGLGSGVSQEQGNVRQDIRQFDSMRLGNTLVHQLLHPLLRINGYTGSVRITWGAEEPEDSAKTAGSLASLATAGIEPTDDGIETLSQRMGLGLRRKPAPMPGVISLGARIPKLTGVEEANADIYREASEALAQTFRGSLAPVRRILSESTSPDDFMRRLVMWFPDWSPEKAAAIAEQALTAVAANAIERSEKG